MHIYIFIKVSSVCSENPTRSCSCAWNPHSCCSWSWVSPVCALALHISGQKASVVSSLASHPLPPPSPELDWTVEDEEERRAATVHTLTWSTVCCHCAVWLSVSRVFPFTVFCCELSGTFWLLFGGVGFFFKKTKKNKTVNVFLSFTRLPLTWGVPAATLVLHAATE